MAYPLNCGSAPTVLRNPKRNPRRLRCGRSIHDVFNIVEVKCLATLESLLQAQDRLALDALVIHPQNDWRSLLSDIKQRNQSLRAQDIQKNVDACQILAHYFHPFASVFETLDLSDQAAEYYATWVQKTKLAQLKQFPNANKRYLYLLAFIKHQYFLRQDALLDIFLKSVRTASHAALKQVHLAEQKAQAERQKALQAISTSHKTARYLLEEITRIVRSTDPSAAEKVEKIERLLSEHEAMQNALDTRKLKRYEQILEQQADGQHDYLALEGQSLRLQHKVASILKNLVFDSASSDETLLKAITHFQITDGHIGLSPPLDFLPEKERTLFTGDERFRTSLYKILLFQSIADAVRSGKLNLKYSYRYRAIQDYLIPTARWQQERDRLLTLAGLEPFADSAACLANLKTRLEATYQRVNDRYSRGDNICLTMDASGHAKIRTPTTPYSEEEVSVQTAPFFS